ncbi:cupin domain-containing protein [Microbacterium sp. GXF7504]
MRSTVTALVGMAAAGMLLVGCAGQAAPATATATSSPTASPDPVAAVDVAAGSIEGPVSVEVPGGTDGVGVTFREITLQPGAGTGKHCHDGQLIAVVAEGALTHYAPNHPGGVHVYETGSAVIEGPGYVHEGRNEGDVPVVLWVTYVIPEGDPLAETDLAHCEG